MNPRLLGNVREGAIAVVMVEGVKLWLVEVGAAVALVSLELAAEEVLIQAVFDVVADVEVEVAVAVKIAPSSAAAQPLAAPDARPGGDIGKRAVMVVMIEPVARLRPFVARQRRARAEVEIGPAVVIIVEDRHAAAHLL